MVFLNKRIFSFKSVLSTLFSLCYVCRGACFTCFSQESKIILFSSDSLNHKLFHQKEEMQCCGRLE